ncbi:hypothetical protein [Desulfosporosinus sp. BG]|uniref:hypothetical protein n=1 Tax=Desulfosporosinus sp. BG TaxID=1633135 RepID=UPI00083B9877|nr:hypothetical protein [Desulfosporosinus sp. BG]ODA41368.1 Histidinol phosphatase and related hydrolases of the PHP family [Desulfosporosinus sp. BG]
MKRNHRLTVFSLVSTMAFCLVTGSLAFANSNSNVSKDGKWVAGDFHNHTYLTDGSKTEADVLNHAFTQYGLDWFTNSEHGGAFSRDANGSQFTMDTPNALLSTDSKYYLWRWATLKDYSYPIIQAARKQYNDKILLQGLEWNVPTHEHASVGIAADEPTAISKFEYIFDQNDKDTSRASEGLTKDNTTAQSAVDGAKWLEDNYPDSSYFVLAHPSRQQKYSIADIRDFNNAAPDVAFGFEGLPGHQKEANRGGFGNNFGSNTYKARTYGGADYMIAKVGGLWDALLGEGRHFWNFVNSDFHNEAGDFWPGEYCKTYSLLKGDDPKSVVASLRSGNSFAVHGDLINALDFSISSKNNVAVMGQDLEVEKGDNAQITIRFKSPEVNNNGDKPVVSHIDLIAGDVTGKAQPGTDEYTKDTNESSKVIASFDSKSWKKDNGWNVIVYNLKNVEKNQYFRLRGTNLAPNTLNETDAEGNPLVDSLMGDNNENKAYADLWFYSNPIFIQSK